MSRVNKAQYPLQSRIAPTPNKQLMNLKVLYTLDDETTYLGRSSKPFSIRVIEIPDSALKIGAVDLKKCLQIVLQSSPELISDSYDFSCYSKDISEPDEPYVGHGMVSNLKDKKGENLVPGRVCTSFASLLGGSSSNETLEVKLRLLKINKHPTKKRQSPASSTNSHQYEQQQPQQQQQQQQSQQDNNSSDNDAEDFVAPQGRYYKRSITAASSNANPTKASRTKSLPVTYNKLPPTFKPKTSTGPTLSQRMNSIASTRSMAMYSPASNASNSTIADIFQDKKRIKLDESASGSGNNNVPIKKKPTCLACGTNESKTWKIVKKPLPQLQHRTGVLCNDCNATMLRSAISNNNNNSGSKSSIHHQPLQQQQQQQQQQQAPSASRMAQHPRSSSSSASASSSPAIPNLSHVDINEIFSVEYDISRFGGPLTDIDPLPQQATPVDEPSKATRLNTTLIDMEEDKENTAPSRLNSPENDKPISLLHGDDDDGSKQSDFEKMLVESFHEFSSNQTPMINSPSNGGSSGVSNNNSNKKAGWANVLFAHAEEDEHPVEQDTGYNHKRNYVKTPSDEFLKPKQSIASSPPMYNTPLKDDESSSLDRMHSSILTSINDDITSLTNWGDSNAKISPPTSFLDDEDDANLTEEEKI